MGVSVGGSPGRAGVLSQPLSHCPAHKQRHAHAPPLPSSHHHHHLPHTHHHHHHHPTTHPPPQGSSEFNITTLIDQKDSIRALRAVHGRFYLEALPIGVGLVGPGLIGSTFLQQMGEQVGV